MYLKRKSSDDSQEYLINQILFNKYKILQKIGKGSFGHVYTCQSIYSHKLYAIKLEPIKRSNFLEEESLILTYLNTPRIPKVKLFGYSGVYMVLIMELLGPSLEQLLNNLSNKKMSLRCVCNIAYQLISILETIHNNNIIHQDLKPSNINIGINNKNKFLYLIDFGLAKKYRSNSTKKHYPFESGLKLIGNARFSSLNSLMGGSQSRRDDLESLGYILIFLCKGKLPWQGKLSYSKEDKYYKIKEIKKNTRPEELCKNLPIQFEEYIKYTKNLKYEEDPDYNYLKKLFITVLKNNNWEFDYYYDWDKTTLTNEEVTSINNSLSTYAYSNQEKKIPKLYTKISELKEERKLFGDNFEVERFVFDIEEESIFNTMKKNNDTQEQENENDIEIYNYSNSMTPYNKNRIRKKHAGCLPCQPKEYREDDDACCLIY